MSVPLDAAVTQAPAAREPDTRSGDGLVAAVCVYCGSATGHDPAYLQAAESLGRALGASGRRLVYGGGNAGLMGAVARATLAGGGQVTGIIPTFLKNIERMLANADDLVVVEDMHTRKRLMFERADAFVTLPGGIGTLEEVVEQLTWSQLGRHGKPILFLNVRGFFDPLLELFAHMRHHGFIRPELEFRYLVAERVEDVLPMLEDAARRGAAQAGPAVVPLERMT